MRFIEELRGGDLRSLGKSKQVAEQVIDQKSFNDLFNCIFYPDRVVAMRSIDAVEKITINHSYYLQLHKSKLLALLNEKSAKEFKWHLPLLIVRLKLTSAETGKVWDKLSQWALDQKESRIVRVHSIQGLYDLLKNYPELKADFDLMVEELKRSGIPSIIARLKQFR